VREMEKEKTKGQGDGRGCKKELRSTPTREAWPLHLVRYFLSRIIFWDIFS
jgi:hypothetical protein